MYHHWGRQRSLLADSLAKSPTPPPEALSSCSHTLLWTKLFDLQICPAFVEPAFERCQGRSVPETWKATTPCRSPSSTSHTWNQGRFARRADAIFQFHP